MCSLFSNALIVRRLKIKVHHEVNSLTGNVSTYYRV